MSWKAYVDSSLVGTGDLDKAAIFNAEGSSVWAKSDGFEVSPQEMAAVVASYRNTDKSELLSSGLHVAGQKYFVLRADERSIYGKKGQEGVIIVKTVQAILVAHYPDGKPAGVAANTVEKLADYLISAGY